MKKSALTVKYQERLHTLMRLFGKHKTLKEVMEIQSYIKNSRAS